MIKLRRLKDVIIRGNFTIKCEDNLQFIMLQSFFYTSNDNIKFKNIVNILNQIQPIHLHFPYMPLMICGDKRNKFIIKYESLAELLKLREIFRVRANGFDMNLIKKRGYNPFTADFYKLCENTDIIKVRK